MPLHERPSKQFYLSAELDDRRARDRLAEVGRLVADATPRAIPSDGYLPRSAREDPGHGWTYDVVSARDLPAGANPWYEYGVLLTGDELEAFLSYLSERLHEGPVSFVDTWMEHDEPELYRRAEGLPDHAALYFRHGVPIPGIVLYTELVDRLRRAEPAFEREEMVLLDPTFFDIHAPSQGFSDLGPGPGAFWTTQDESVVASEHGAPEVGLHWRGTTRNRGAMTKALRDAGLEVRAEPDEVIRVRLPPRVLDELAGAQVRELSA